MNEPYTHPNKRAKKSVQKIARLLRCSTLDEWFFIQWMQQWADFWDFWFSKAARRILRISDTEKSHMDEWNMPHIRMCHVTHTNESRDTYGSHVCVKHDTHTHAWRHESRHTYEWVVSHKWTSHVTHTHVEQLQCDRRNISNGESRHTYEWVMSHTRRSHVAHTNESCHTYEWVMSHEWTSHVTHTHICQQLQCDRRDISNSESRHTHEGIISHIQISHITHTNESCHTNERVMSHTHTCWAAAARQTKFIK